jgi:hypothetical protein
MSSDLEHMLTPREIFAMLSRRRAAALLLGACCAAILLQPTTLLAQQFDPPDTAYANGNREEDPAFLQTLPIEPTHRAYIPASVDLSYRLPEPQSGRCRVVHRVGHRVRGAQLLHVGL